ncbi:LIM domain-containing protein [Quillaja saponaria]|uniref:LIM domain-containing protein n=1 Tax=Quillaja saponaria TaxID=32244 RepID=A0AAD7L6E7_QUISA|nr:LIM domain-containing protein [Quillaja saponaria]
MSWDTSVSSLSSYFWLHIQYSFTSICKFTPFSIICSLRPLANFPPCSLGLKKKCSVCTKTAYPLEKVTVEGEFYHKSCFRCSHGGCFLTTSSYAALDGILYCKHHFAQLFKDKGSYNHLIQTASMKKNGIQLPEQQKTETESDPEPRTIGCDPHTRAIIVRGFTKQIFFFVAFSDTFLRNPYL